jgi:hypothetical protein
MRCGGGAEVFPEEQSINGGGYYVACAQPKFPFEECWLSLGEEYDRDAMPEHRFRTKEEAIAAWNVRVNSIAELERERDALLCALRQIAEMEHVATTCAALFINRDGVSYDCDCPVGIAETALGETK